MSCNHANCNERKEPLFGATVDVCQCVIADNNFMVRSDPLMWRKLQYLLSASLQRRAQTLFYGHKVKGHYSMSWMTLTHVMHTFDCYLSNFVSEIRFIFQMKGCSDKMVRSYISSHSEQRNRPLRLKNQNGTWENKQRLHMYILLQSQKIVINCNH